MYYLQNKATNIESCIPITSSTTEITKIADGLSTDIWLSLRTSL